MNTIIYSRDFEPITVIDLPVEVLESAERTGGIVLALKNANEPTSERRYVTLECLKLKWWDSTVKTVFVTEDEELAMLLKPEWLVGQKAVVGAYQRTLQVLTTKLKGL
jgi:hypothetical protein